MKILMTRNTLVDGRSVNEGEVVDASDRAARLLLAIGKAEKADADPELTDEKADAAAALVETAVPGGKRSAKRGK